MTKDVLVTVSGMQFDLESEEAIESVSVGTYEKDNEVHRIRYEEYVMTEEGDQEPHINVMEIWPDHIELKKSGGGAAHMIFRTGMRSDTCYATPFGEIMVGMDTNAVETNIAEDLIQGKINYSLFMNREFVSNCEINITIKSR